jgi:hypothetical protein
VELARPDLLDGTQNPIKMIVDVQSSKPFSDVRSYE